MASAGATTPCHAGQAKWHRAPAQLLFFCEPKGCWRLQQAICECRRWTVPRGGGVGTTASSGKCLRCSYCTKKAFMWLNLHIMGYSHLGSLFRGITQAFWLAHALSGLQQPCKKNTYNWRPRLAKAPRLSPVFSIPGDICIPWQSPAYPSPWHAPSAARGHHRSRTASSAAPGAAGSAGWAGAWGRHASSKSKPSTPTWPWLVLSSN